MRSLPKVVATCSQIHLAIADDHDTAQHGLLAAAIAAQVLEIDPRTKHIVWQYQDQPRVNFFSPFISNAQRLWNGNTLINEGTLDGSSR